MEFTNTILLNFLPAVALSTPAPIADSSQLESGQPQLWSELLETRNLCRCQSFLVLRTCIQVLRLVRLGKLCLRW